jgi:hypothetical protein
MYSIYRQSRSNHRRGFTGTLLRSEFRTRSGHDNRTLIRLIDLDQASQQLQLPVSTLQLAVDEGFIPHYNIHGYLRFDPAELSRWVRTHRIDEFIPTATRDEPYYSDWDREGW